MYFIHYDGWSRCYDEFIPADSERIAPFKFYTSRNDIPKYTRHDGDGERVYGNVVEGGNESPRNNRNENNVQNNNNNQEGSNNQNSNNNQPQQNQNTDQSQAEVGNEEEKNEEGNPISSTVNIGTEDNNQRNLTSGTGNNKSNSLAKENE